MMEAPEQHGTELAGTGRGGFPRATTRGGTAAAPRQRLADALGLSTSHISPRGRSTRERPSERYLGPGRTPMDLPQHDAVEGKWACEVAVGGSLLSVKGRKPPERQQYRGLRGEVQGFSKASRRRLMRKIASIDRETLETPPIFGTLTYPGVWPKDPKQWKRDLDAWGKRLRRRYPKACVIWKLEPQKRGAPHYHLLIFNVPHMDKHWLSQSWYEVVSSGDIKHLRAGTKIESIRTWRGVMSYASKYTAKVVEELPEGWDAVGRMWGIIGRDNLPIHIVRFAVDRKTAIQLRDFLWKIIGGPPPGWVKFADDGMTAMLECEQTYQILRLLLNNEP